MGSHDFMVHAENPELKICYSQQVITKMSRNKKGPTLNDTIAVHILKNVIAT